MGNKKTTILFIGGSVVKEAYTEIKQAARRKLFDVLIMNGGALFHDFQRTTEKLAGHSYPLDELVKNYSVLEPASKLVWEWVKYDRAPKRSLVDICQTNEIEVMMFTTLAADFWHLFSTHWELISNRAWFDFRELCRIMQKEFRFINMGSAVIGPEVFTKALAVAKPQKFTTIVVDFMDMYRPRTRVGRYGHYCKTDHKSFLKLWLKYGLDPAIYKSGGLFHFGYEPWNTPGHKFIREGVKNGKQAKSKTDCRQKASRSD